MDRDSDNESVNSRASGKSNVSRQSAASGKSNSSIMSGRASRSSQNSPRSRRAQFEASRNSGGESGDEAIERRSVLDSGDEQDGSPKAVPGSRPSSSSPVGSRPVSRTSAPASRSPSRSRSRSGSPASPRSASGSPAHSRSKSGSPARSRSKSGSPARSRSKSGSPARSRSASGSPARSRTKSRSPARSRSKSRSPARSRSKSRSPARSRSKSRSPARSRSKSRSLARSRSKSGSPARSRNNSRSPARSRSGSRGSVRSRSKSGSPMRSRNRSGSPASRSTSRNKSRSRSRSKSGSRSRSRSKSRSRSRSRSKSGSRSRSRSKSGSRSRSRSKSGSRSRSRSKSRSRGKSGSRSRSRSKSGSRSRSRSKSASRSRSRSGSPGSASGVKASRKSHVLSDSDDDDARPSKKSKLSSKRSRSSGAESGDESGGEGSPAKKRQHAISDSEDEGPNGRRSENGDAAATHGDADEQKAQSSEDEGVRPDDQQEEFVNDFDAMMARKKELMGGSKRRKMNVDIINDNEELISIMVGKMRQAADEDRRLNQQRKPATKKMALLDLAIRQISKTDLLEGFLDANVLTALTDWLAPMPDRSLPSNQIRDQIIKWLTNLPPLSQEMLKTSGIGKAVMYLYRHPRETRFNKERCGRLIAKWSRPIFNNSDDFKSLTKEERLERDLEMKDSGRLLTFKNEPVQEDSSGKILRPGDPGWCYRARVPHASSKDYVVRPKSTADGEVRKNVKTKKTRLDKQLLHFQQKKSMGKMKRAVTMSMEGRNMPL